MSSFDGSLAVLLAAKYCRSSPLFQWREEALGKIGKRKEKYCFRVDFVNLMQDHCGEMLLTLFPSQLSFHDFQKESTLYRLKSLLVTLKHPNIVPVMDLYYSNEKKAILVVHPFISKGSLKDYIHRTSPTCTYEKKYRLDYSYPVRIGEIRHYGAQILDALIALRSKKIVCEHLSTSNILLDNGNAKIANIENTLLCINRHLDSRERTAALEPRTEIDLLLFGHVLYEMTTGLELLGSQLEHSVLELMHPHISQVLRMIFNPKDQFNTVSSKEFDEQISKISERSILTQDLDMIRQLPLFTEAEISSPGESFGGFRLDSTMKNTIKTVMHINESRNQAYRVHFNEKEAARKARDRAERKVSEEREKQLQRVHQMTRKNGSSSSKDMSMIRRKSYRAAHAKALHGSSFTSTSSAHNVSSA